MDQIIKRDSVQEANNRKQKLEDKGNIINNNYQNNYNNNNRNNDHHQQQNGKQETFRTYTATNGYTGNRPLCERCTLHHIGSLKKSKKRSFEDLKPREQDTRRTSGNTTRNDPFPPFLLLEAQTQVIENIRTVSGCMDSRWLKLVIIHIISFHALYCKNGGVKQTIPSFRGILTGPLTFPEGVGKDFRNPDRDDPKKHYVFKSGLLGHNGSLGVDFSKLRMIEDDWKLESEKVSLLGRGLNSPVKPKEVEKVRIKDSHHLEHVIQQPIFQHLTPSRYYDVYRYYHPQLNSSVGEPSPLSVKQG
ncbi:hypothetical protein Tco_0333553 [Tanacetum coccineum]